MCRVGRPASSWSRVDDEVGAGEEIVEVVAAICRASSRLRTCMVPDTVRAPALDESMPSMGLSLGLLATLIVAGNAIDTPAERYMPDMPDAASLPRRLSEGQPCHVDTHHPENGGYYVAAGDGKARNETRSLLLL